MPSELPDSVNAEKVAFIEEQANRTLNFQFETREILLREARIMLNWHFAILLGAGSAFLAILNSANGPESPGWLLASALAATIVGTVGATVLLLAALKMRDVTPTGNEPRVLTAPERLTLDIVSMRYYEALNLQGRIDRLVVHNRRVGRAINLARLLIVTLPIAVLIAVGINCLVAAASH